MGTIIISTNVSLDGVVQDPDGQEGFARGGWFNQSGGADLEPWAKVFTDEADEIDAVLLGRRSDAWFAERWVSREGAWADRLNALPKYVVSSTLAQPGWSHATVLDHDPAAAIAALKQTVDGDILVYGSYQLVRTLVARNLADELRLVLFPVVLGTGLRLFDGMADSKPLRRIGLRQLGDGLVHCTYAFASAS